MGRQSGSVEDKLLSFLIVSGCRLQTPDEGSVTHFGLSISSNDLKIPSSTQPLCLLF